MTAPAPRAPRRRRVLPAVVVAILLGGLGATVAVDVVAVQTDDRSLVWPFLRIAHDLRTAHWSQTSVVVTAAVGAGVGLLLLLCALVPGRTKLVAVESRSPDEVVGIPARSVRRALTSAALGVDGVGRAEVEYRRRRAVVTVTSPLRDPGVLAGDVRNAVLARLDQLALQRPPEVRVAVRHRAPDGTSSNLLPGPSDTGASGTPTSGVPSDGSTSDGSASDGSTSDGLSSTGKVGAVADLGDVPGPPSSGGSAPSPEDASSPEDGSRATGSDLEGADR